MGVAPVKPAESLEDLVKSFFEIGRRIVLAGEQHQPLIFAHSHLFDKGGASKGAAWAGIALDFHSEEAKLASIQKIRAFFAIYGVDRYVFVTEGWQLKLDKDAPDAADYLEGRKRPSESPDRIEILQVIAADRDREVLGTAVLGEAHGKRTVGDLAITEPEPHPEGKKGRMQSLLPERGQLPCDDPELRERLCARLGLSRFDMPGPVIH